MYKTLLQFSFLTLFLASCSSTNELTQQEITALKQELREVITSFNKGDAKLTKQKTHPIMFTAISKENFMISINEGVKNAHYVETLSLIINNPFELHDLGKEEMCFVPTYMTGVVNDPNDKSIDGLKFIDESFRVAIRSKQDKKWFFLELGTIEEQNKLFPFLFPSLAKDIKLPKNEFTVIE